MADTPHQLPGLEGLIYWTPDPALRKALLAEAREQGDNGLPDVTQLPIEDPPQILRIHALAAEACLSMQERAREILLPHSENIAQSVELLTTELGADLEPDERKGIWLGIVRARVFYDNLAERFTAGVDLAIKMADALILEYFGALKARHPHGEILDDAYDPPMTVRQPEWLMFGQTAIDPVLEWWDRFRGELRDRTPA